MNVKGAIRVSAIETLRAMIFTESWGLSDIAYRKGVYEPDEHYLDSLCYDISELEDLNYLIVHECNHDIFSNHYFFVSYNLIKCEQLLGITRNMFFERGVCYENINYPKFSVQGYEVLLSGEKLTDTFLKRDNKWLYVTELRMNISLDKNYGVYINPPRITGVTREATRKEIIEVEAKGVRLW